MNHSRTNRMLTFRTVAMLCFAFAPFCHHLCWGTQQDKKAAPKKLPTLTVRFVDEQGNPLPNVKVVANSSSPHPDYRRKNLVHSTSDKTGRVKIEIYPQLRILRIWATRKSSAQLFFNWEKNEIDSIPESYEVVMQKGRKIGGIVVDSNGKPIKGAKIDVSRIVGGRKADPKPRVKLGTWLAEGEDAAVSDANGKWSIDNAPDGDDLRLRFLIEHPDFIKEKSRVDMARYNVSLKQLHEGIAVFQLKSGHSLQGKVTDADGKPVSDGLVIFGDQPYRQTGSQEVNLSKSGTYVIPSLTPEKIRLTVVAPGFMPTDRIVDVADVKNKVQNFKLQKGKLLKLKFVDQNNKPIPSVIVGLKGWHGQKTLYNERHPNIKESKIPSRSDGNGVYEWDWAPDDLLQLFVGVREWRYSKEIDVIASGTAQTIRLNKPFVFQGKVIDAKSNKPIDQYSIIPITYSSMQKSARGIAQSSWQKTFGTNEFAMNNAFSSDNGTPVAFRFQASGYRDLTTERYLATSPTGSKTIRLEPVPPHTLRVINPDGQPSKSARIWVVKPDQGTMVNKFSDYFSNDDGPVYKNQNGKFEYGAPETRHAIVAASEKGYAEKYLEIDEQLKELNLKPWASLSGVLHQSGKPVSGASVILAPIRQLGGDHPHVQDIFQATTNSDGRFVFKQVPPVPVTVSATLNPWRDYPITSSRKVAVNLQPGKAHKVELGSGGLEVTGKVRLIGDNADKIQFRYGINNLIKVEDGFPLPSHALSPVQYANGDESDWNTKLQKGLKPNVTRESFFVKLKDDGTFLISGVRPGKYRFLIKIYEPPTGCLIEPVGYGYLEFSTNDFDAKDNAIDLGTLDVKLKTFPKVGDTLPNFRFQTLDNKGYRHLQEYRGQYVLIDYWASWCAPCIKAFADLKDYHQDIRRKKNATILSISVDKELIDAKTTALRQKISWEVGFAGDRASKTNSGSALGISTLPTYVVLDPNGKIIYRGFSHEEAFKAIPNK